MQPGRTVAPHSSRDEEDAQLPGAVLTRSVRNVCWAECETKCVSSSLQLYDSEAERFQEWVLSSSVFPAYVRRLYLAANPVLAHPLYDLYQPGDSSDDEGDRSGDGQALSPEAKATAAFAAAQQGAQGRLDCSTCKHMRCAVWRLAFSGRMDLRHGSCTSCQLRKGLPAVHSMQWGKAAAAK
jgi:hypothetical protein